MLKQLGRLIEKHPLLVISIVIFVTLGFSTLLPMIEMKTEFSDFMPDDEIVQASQRISDYFTTGQVTMFLYLNAENTESIITIDSIKDQYFIDQKLMDIPELSTVTSFTMLLDQVCQLEFANNINNCTNEQIQTAINDLLDEEKIKSIKIFDNDDSNEKIDYNRYPRITQGKSINEIDIKNCYISYTNKSLIFSIEVYDLSAFKSKLVKPIKSSNVYEWYIDFENLIKPIEDLDISYRISAHLEPKHSIWELGKGIFENLRNIFNYLKNRELFNSFEKETYLWLKPPGQDMYIPIMLNSANISFLFDTNIIEINVSKDELGNYGIAPRFGIFEVPAKLSNFTAGTRYYQTSFLKLPWFRITANTSYLLERIEKIQNRPILGKIAENILKKIGNMTFDDLDEFLNNPNNTISLPDRLSLKEIDDLWITADIVPDTSISTNILFIKPNLFNDLNIAAKGFLSKDYEKDGKPSASIIILSLNTSGGNNDLLSLTDIVLDKIKQIDAQSSYVSIEATGDNVISQQMNDVTEEANTIIMPMIFVIIIAILYFSFRKFSYIIIPMLSLVVSVIWLFGTMVLLGIDFNTMAVALVPLIMGLGVDYSVHLSHNYRAELGKGKTPAAAIKRSVVEIGSAMFLAMLTTVIAFLSFLSASLPPIRDFGILLALGITYTFITAITFQAALRYILDRRKKEFNNQKKQYYKLDKYMGILSQKILKNQKKIIVILLLITIVGAVGASQIKTSFDFNSFIPEDNPAIELFGKIGENFPFSGQNQEYILLEGDVASVDALKGIKTTHENLADDYYVERNSDNTAKASSVYVIIKQAVGNNVSLIERFNIDPKTSIPKTDDDVKELYDYLWDSFEYSFQIKTNLHKNNQGKYDAAIISIFVDVISEGVESSGLDKDLGRMEKELNQDLSDYGDVDVIITGQFLIMHIITGGLTESQILSTGISLILATIVLIIAYRRLTLGLIAMIPVLISIVWILGTMYFIGYSLDIMTITVTSLTIGIGIDYAIHTTQRFRLIADKTGNINKALCETISRTGGALLIAALTTTFGFATLIFAPIPPEQKFGVITAMTITYSFITSVLLLPLILARWAKWSKKKKGYIISRTPADESYFDNVEGCEKK